MRALHNCSRTAALGQPRNILEARDGATTPTYPNLDERLLPRYPAARERRQWARSSLISHRPATSSTGQTRRLRDVGDMSGLPQTADIAGPGRHFAFGPIGDICSAANSNSTSDHAHKVLRRCSGCSCETSLRRGRIDAPAGLKPVGHMECAGSTARIER
jgi:hypothetical protein